MILLLIVIWSAALAVVLGLGWLIMRAVAAEDQTDREHDA